MLIAGDIFGNECHLHWRFSSAGLIGYCVLASFISELKRTKMRNRKE